MVGAEVGLDVAASILDVDGVGAKCHCAAALVSPHGPRNTHRRPLDRWSRSAEHVRRRCETTRVPGRSSRKQPRLDALVERRTEVARRPVAGAEVRGEEIAL